MAAISCCSFSSPLVGIAAATKERQYGSFRADGLFPRPKRKAQRNAIISVVSSAQMPRWELAASAPTYIHGAGQWLLDELRRLKTIERRPGDGLVLTRGAWDWTVAEDGIYVLQGTMQFHNITRLREMFVPELSADVTLLSAGSVSDIVTSVKVIPEHPGGYPPARADEYWVGYITRAGESTTIKVVVEIKGDAAALQKLKAARVRVQYFSYGPHGRSPHAQHVVLPLQFPKPPPDHSAAQWLRVSDSLQVLPIKTHLLCHQDDPVTVIETYVKEHYQPGDIVAIAESPLAVMQGRFRHPASVRPSWVAKMICLLFHPTSSLATACGMQSLIDVVGKLRVLLAALLGIIFRIIGVRGMFYRVAGLQSKLIDDVTGTLPPYDQFICLGPIDLETTCKDLKEKTGCDVAIVDVNDLKKVDIIGASAGVDFDLVTKALISNPAGNADQQTPLLLIRPRRK